MEGNPQMEFDELKTLLSIGSKWMVSRNGLEFVPLDSADISIEGSTIQLGPHSDRQRGIGGAYPRFFIAGHAVIAVDPDESPAVVNGLMRAALLWKSLVDGPVVAVVPYGRHRCISSRLRTMSPVRKTIQWFLWDGGTVRPFEDVAGEPETHVTPRALYQEHTSAGSYETFSAHEQHRLESNVLGEIRRILPTIDARHIYPQVPSFVGEERKCHRPCGPPPWMAGSW